MREIYKLYRYISDKRYSTIAGTLVYFLLMSVTPFLFWLTLLVGNIDLQSIISHELFAAAQPVISYLQASATGAVGSAGIILLLTSLWSSTNFFYHLRRSGEIIYETDGGRGGLKLRLWSLLIVLLTIIMFAFAATVPILSATVLDDIMPEAIAQVISVTFLALFAFLVAYLLNVFACPYKLGFDKTIGGVMLTVLLWLVFGAGFTVYLQFANPQKLYGAVAAIVVFLLWCYLMVNSLVIGIIYNGKYSGYIRRGIPQKLMPLKIK